MIASEPKICKYVDLPLQHAHDAVLRSMRRPDMQEEMRARIHKLRERIPGYIDCSPFGCRTGFHLLTWGEHSTEDVAKALKESLEFIANEATWDDVPATTIESCGNYRDHSLFTAKEWAKQILEEGISSDPFERKGV